MSRPDMTEILEICLRRMEAGSSIDLVVADYPEQAAELRELLSIAAAAAAPKETGVPAGAQARSRARMLARARELQARPAAGLLWAGLHFFSRHAGSFAFTFAAVLMLLIALVSSNALPGLIFTPAEPAKDQQGAAQPAGTLLEREAGLDSSRADEVARMAGAGQTGAVSFGGFLTRAPAAQGWQAAGISLMVTGELDSQALTLEGAYIEIEGVLQKEGSVQVETLRPLLFPFSGTIEKVSEQAWVVDDKNLVINAYTRMQGDPRPGSQVDGQAARLVDQASLLAISIAVSPGQVSTPKNSATPQPGATATPTPTKTATVTPQRTPEGPLLPVPTRAPEREPTAMLHPEDDDHEETAQPEQEDGHEDQKETKEPDSEHDED